MHLKGLFARFGHLLALGDCAIDPQVSFRQLQYSGVAPFNILSMLAGPFQAMRLHGSNTLVQSISLTAASELHKQHHTIKCDIPFTPKIAVNESGSMLVMSSKLSGSLI